MRAVRQLDATDCGPVALTMILGHWGRFEPIYRLRELAGTTQAGTSLWGLKRAAEQLGLDARGLQADLDGLRTLELPVLVHWEHNHYVVVERFAKTRVRLADPATGRRWVSLEEFQTKWTGRVLQLEPGPTFVAGRFMGRRGVWGLLSHLHHYRGAGGVVAELTLATALLGLLDLGAPLLSQILFDQVLILGQVNLLPVLLVAIFALSGFRAFFRGVRSLLSNQLSTRLNFRMRLSYLEHLFKLPLRVHETRLTGDLLTRFSDLSRIRSQLSDLLVYTPATAVSLTFSLALLFLYNVQLALVSLITVPFQILYVLWLAPRLRDLGLATRRKEGEVDSAILGSLEGFSTLKAFRAEAWALSGAKTHVSAFMDLTWRQVLLSNTSNLVFRFLGGLAGLLVLWFGAVQVLELTLSVGQLVAAYALMRNVSSDIAEVTDSFTSLQGGMVASDRLIEMLELAPEQRDGVLNELQPLRTELRVENLGFGYHIDAPILTGASFRLPCGSYSALVGANGAGKSTLAALLTGTLQPNAGRMLWDGLLLDKVALDALRAQAVYLRQEVPLFYATLLENLLLGRSGDPAEVESLLQDIGFGEVLRRLPEGLGTTIGGESPYRLSTGERQMLGLARALLSDAPLLVLDEPTATLDAERERTVVERLEALKGTRTLLVITHRPALLGPADQILHLEGGRILAERRDARRASSVGAEPSLRNTNRVLRP